MSEHLLELLESTCKRAGAPAASGIVVSQDAVVAQGAVGVRRLGDDTPVTVYDKFHIGSCGKAMTATICAVLVHRGLMRWSITPLEVFPELEGHVHPQFEKITLEMLLRHTAGIPPYTRDEHFEDLPPLEGSAREQRTTFARWLLTERAPVSEPGTGCCGAYSNAGYAIAAALAEASSGASWQELLRDFLAQPLGIEVGTGWPALQDPEQPWGHWFKDGNLVPHPPDDDYTLHPFMAPAGDVHLSMPDYGCFLQMHLRALQGKNTLLPAELLRHLHNHGRPGVGLGWGVGTSKNRKIGVVSNHMGGGGTFVCVAGISHSRDRAVAMATNAGDEANESVEKAVAVGFKEMLAYTLGHGDAE
jgi:D-alanyl-D-alanine carboxypeptidase